MEFHPKRLCKCSEHIGNELWHGIFSGYTRHKCRCDKCRKVFADYYRDKYRTDENHRAKVLKRQADSYVPKPKQSRERKPTLVERRKRLWEAQNGLCSLCNKPLALEEACLDHDHACCDTKARAACGNCDRGALHNHCNAILGFSGDNPDHLMQAVAYLLTNRDVLATI